MIQFLATEIADLKQRVADLEGGQEQPPFSIGTRVFNTANLTIPNVTSTALTFNSEDYDTDSLHSTSSNTGRLTCTQEGRYLAILGVQWAANAAGFRFAGIRLNGSNLIAADHRLANTGDVTVMMVPAGPITMVVGDYLDVIVYQNSGGNLDIATSTNLSPYFEMWRLA